MDHQLDEQMQLAGRVNGHVERFEGSYVVGWAARPDWASHSRIRVVSTAGDELASGLSDRERGDLMSLGHGRSDMAFRIFVPGLGDEALIHVFADDVELPGSPMPVGAGHFDGVFTTSGSVISGWVSERRHGFLPPEVEILDQDGAIVCVMQSSFGEASDHREGEAASFQGLLHQSCFLNPEVRLTARADRKPFADSCAALSLEGHLDLATSKRVVGWLYSRRHRTVHSIWRSTVTACLPPEPARACPGKTCRRRSPQAASPGFEADLPELPGRELQASVISVRFAGLKPTCCRGRISSVTERRSSRRRGAPPVPCCAGMRPRNRRCRS